MGFSMPKNTKGSGKFKPKLIGSIIGVIFFGSVAVYSGVNMILGDGNVIQGVAYEIKGDFYTFIFAVAFGIGFGYWGFANFLERKKVKAERHSKKKKSNKQKKSSKLS